MSFGNGVSLMIILVVLGLVLGSILAEVVGSWVWILIVFVLSFVPGCLVLRKRKLEEQKLSQVCTN